MRSEDIGHGHEMRYFSWDPDRALNPKYDGIPSEPKAGVIIDHPSARDGSPCSGAVTFDTSTMRRISLDRPLWRVESWDPLTISPSVLCSCGDHGFIRNGRWEPA